jgi:hypothetical protein
MESRGLASRPAPDERATSEGRVLLLMAPNLVNDRALRAVGAAVCGGRPRRMSRPSAAVAADDARYGPPAPDERATRGEIAMLHLDEVILTIELARGGWDVMAVLTHCGIARGGRGEPRPYGAGARRVARGRKGVRVPMGSGDCVLRSRRIKRK